RYIVSEPERTRSLAMPGLLLYLRKVNLAIILFYFGYRLLLRKLTIYSLSRFYLLFALLFSFIYPLFDWVRLFERPVQELPGEVVYLMHDWEPVRTRTFDGWPWLIGALGLGSA